MRRLVITDNTTERLEKIVERIIITVQCSKCPISKEGCQKLKEILKEDKCPILTAIEWARIKKELATVIRLLAETV